MAFDIFNGDIWPQYKNKTKANYAGTGVYINQFTKYCCQMKFQNFEYFPCKFSFYLTLVVTFCFLSKFSYKSQKG